MDKQPQVQFSEGLKECIYSFDNIPALIPDSDLPKWHDPFSWLQFSEAETWAEVARWGTDLYKMPGHLSPALHQRSESSSSVLNRQCKDFDKNIQ